MEKSFSLKEFNPSFLNPNTPFEGTIDGKIISFEYADPVLLAHINSAAGAICARATFHICLPYIAGGVRNVTVEFEPSGVYRSTIQRIRECVKLLEDDFENLPDHTDPDDERFYAEVIIQPHLAAMAGDCVRDWNCFSTYANGVECLDIEAIFITPVFVVEMLKAVAKHLQLNEYDTAEFVNDGMTCMTSGQGHLVKLLLGEYANGNRTRGCL